MRARFMVAESYVTLLEAIGRRSLSTHEIHDEIGPKIDHTNVSTVLTRAIDRRWLEVVGHVDREGGGMPLRVVRVTPLGRLFLKYADAEREAYAS